MAKSAAAAGATPSTTTIAAIRMLRGYARHGALSMAPSCRRRFDATTPRCHSRRRDRMEERMNRVGIVMLVTLAAMASQASAQLYKCAAADGKVTYQSEP